MNKQATFDPTPVVPVAGDTPIRALVAGFEKSGKTFNAIKWALWFQGIDPTGWTPEQVRAAAPTSPVVVIETSREDTSVYADTLPFRVVRVPSHNNNPGNITKVVMAYANEPSIGAVVVDSYSEFWEGEGGTLSLVDKLGGGIGGWKQIKTLETAQLDAMRDSRLDMWFTVRMKDGIIVEKTDAGETTVKKERDRIVARRNAPYEFGQIFHVEENDGALTTTFTGRALDAKGGSLNGRRFVTDSPKAAKAFMAGLATFMHREFNV